MIASPSVFDRALPALARATQLPEAVAAAAWVGEWLTVLAAHPGMAQQFDGDLDAYARELHQVGVLVGEQGAGFLLALWSRLNVAAPLQAELVRQVDRRKGREGVVWCKWRGWLPRGEFERWRSDDAVRRAGLPNKHERER